jgi:hypothetical protein
LARRVFYSFHYKPDNWRVSQVRNIGTIEDNKPASDNDWEEVVRSGDQAIKNWISDQMRARSCVAVLIGANTSGRKWINYEIDKAWRDEKGIVGIHIHNLQNSDEKKASKGSNPFFNRFVDGSRMSNIVKTYDPPYSTSTNVYNHIANSLADWIEEAIRIRKDYQA